MLVQQMNWMSFLVEMKWVILVIFCLIGTLIFRQSLRNLINRVGGFEKTEEGFAVDTSGTTGPEEPEADEEDELMAGPDEAVAEETDTMGEEEATAEERAPMDRLFDAWVLNDPQESIERMGELVEEIDDEEILLSTQLFIADRRTELDFQDGIQHFRRLAEENPSDWRPYNWMANKLAGADLYRQSLGVLDDGLESAIETSRLVVSKARILYEIGQIDEAVSLLSERAAAEDPPSLTVYKTLAAYREENEDIEAARDAYLTALEHYSGVPHLLVRYGRFLTDHGMKKEAILRFQRVQELDNSNSVAPTLLGNLLLDEELVGKALESYQTANEAADGEEAWIHANIGNLYLNRGLFGPAIEKLERALELDPESEYAHDRLAKARKLKEQENEGFEELLASARRAIGKESANTGDSPG